MCLWSIFFLRHKKLRVSAGATNIQIHAFTTYTNVEAEKWSEDSTFQYGNSKAEAINCATLTVEAGKHREQFSNLGL